MGRNTDVLDDGSISAYGKLVFFVLSKFANKDGQCFPSIKTIAAKSSLSNKTVLKALAELSSAGWVNKEKRKSECGDYDSNLYVLPCLVEVVPDIHNVVSDIHNGCVSHTQGVVSDVHTNLSILTNKNNYNDCPRKITDVHINLAVQFQDAIRARKPDYKFAGTVEKWADTIRLMMEKDNRTADKIKAVIDWSQQDSFWQNNILSPDKLRKQFDRLELQMEQIGSKQQAVKRKKLLGDD